MLLYVCIRVNVDIPMNITYLYINNIYIYIYIYNIYLYNIIYISIIEYIL